MLNIWLSDSTIALRKNAATWQQALDICARPLLDAEIITTDYLSAIKTQHEKLGALLCPRHPGWPCRMPDQKKGAKGLGLSLLKLEEGVSFHTEEFDPVDVIILLAAPDKHSHIEMISALAELFSSEKDLHELHQARNVEEIKKDNFTVLITL
ncbi:PTS sugar transporter subunit IIA [Escherichia coli]|nr:PTS sugar transporter subunit IIA [Escherichia coli]